MSMYRWEKTHYSDFIEKESDEWREKSGIENRRMDSYAFHNTDWAYELYKQMDLCDGYDFVETERITKEAVKLLIYHQRKWLMENELASSSSFPPALVDKFANDTVDNLNKWYLDIINSR